MTKPSTSVPARRLADAGTEGKAPIAITGIGCRFPGAHGPQQFWQLLLDAVDAVATEGERGGDACTLHAVRPDRDGLPRSGLLDKIDEFDAEFFGMSPREAQRTDPQARLLLETAWEAIEDAGLNPDHLAGSRTAVFVGQAASNYWELVRQAGQPDIHAVVGSESRATLPGRVSYTFDLRGPSVSVDTACSASLTAVHQACQSIRAGESVMAIAAGANLALLPDEGIAYSGAAMLAPDGRCKFGDASADGFVRSDGVGVVVLKPLAAATANGDRVYAVILGSAINNDGRSGGLPMTPGEKGQEELLRHAYQAAGVVPSEVDYVEAHGAGTSVGDPVELTALGAVLGEGRAANHPCLVGSVKTNIGHTEAAAGIAGLIKTALCLQHKVIPPSLHFREPNPTIAWDAMPLRVATQCEALPRRGRPANAGVSSFGISGANAHVVLAEHVQQDEAAAPLPPPPTGLRILTLSARSPEALRAMTRSYADFLGPGGAGRALDLRDICYTAAVRRKHLTSRLAVVGASHEEIENRLRCYLADRAADGVACSDVLAGRPQVAFVFPGQGSQWLGMCKDLLGTSREFREGMRCCDEAVEAETGVSVLRELEGDGSRLAEVDILQPTLWAIEVALSGLWRSLGLEPDLVVGHSMGEVAAAHVAGALSLRDSAAVICRRSRLARKLSGRGAMATVALSEAEATEIIADHADEIAVAACNGPSSTVLSGNPKSLREILSAPDGRTVSHKLLDVDFASHSPQVAAIEGALGHALGDIRPSPGRIPIHSTVTDTITDGSCFGAKYWAENLRLPVQFMSAVRHIAARAPTLFIEISPHPILMGAITDVLRQHSMAGAALASLRRQQPSWPCLLGSLAALHVLGGPVSWERLNKAGRCVRLPSYAWQHKRHWCENSAPRSERAAGSPASPEARQGAAALASKSPGNGYGAQLPVLPSRPVEFTGVMRLLDPADQTVAQMDGARLQFVAKEFSGAHRGGFKAIDGRLVPRSPRTTPLDSGGQSASAGPEGPQRAAAIGRRIVDEVADVLAVPPEPIETQRSLRDMGLDSLMANELAIRLSANVGVAFPASTLLAQRPLAEVVNAVQLTA